VPFINFPLAECTWRRYTWHTST